MATRDGQVDAVVGPWVYVGVAVQEFGLGAFISRPLRGWRWIAGAEVDAVSFEPLEFGEPARESYMVIL